MGVLAGLHFVDHSRGDKLCSSRVVLAFEGSDRINVCTPHRQVVKPDKKFSNRCSTGLSGAYVGSATPAVRSRISVDLHSLDNRSVHSDDSVTQ